MKKVIRVLLTYILCPLVLTLAYGLIVGWDKGSIFVLIINGICSAVAAVTFNDMTAPIDGVVMFMSSDEDEWVELHSNLDEKEALKRTYLRMAIMKGRGEGDADSNSK